MKAEIIESKKMRGNWESYSGNYRIILGQGNNVVAFELPDKGGRQAMAVAASIEKMWESGYTAAAITAATGCAQI